MDNRKESFERSITLEPRNAVPYDKLCRYLRDAESEAAAAVPLCRKAVQLNGHDAEYWLDLAETYYEIGNANEQRSAIEQAIAVDPKTPQVAWNAATFYLLQGEVEPAVQLFPGVLQGDPSLAPATLKIAWQAAGKVEPVLRIMPPDPAVYLQFLALLTAQDQRVAAAEVWSRLMSLNAEVSYHDAVFYVNQLLDWQDVHGAEQAWAQLGEHSAGFRQYERGSENLVINGSFEQEILNGGFGWRIVPRGTKIDFDDETANDGTRSARIFYDVPVLDAGLTQLIPVDPNTSYTASAWVKSEQLETANGPRLAIFEAYTGANLGTSEPTSDTTGWKMVQVQFATPSHTSLVSLRFVRDRQDTVIRGQMWIDDVRLTKSGAPPHQLAR